MYIIMKKNKRNGSYFPLMGLLMLVVVGMLAFGIKEEPKKYKVEMTLEEWSKFTMEVGKARDYLRASNIDLKFVFPTDSVLQSFQIKIASQINPVLAAEAKADSAKIKAPKQ